MSTSGRDCRGCKLGYSTGERDINKAKCRIKLCCFRDKKLETCADCNDFNVCDVIDNFQDKSGKKHRKYKETIRFIIDNGYDKFKEKADKWNGPYGRLT